MILTLAAIVVYLTLFFAAISFSLKRNRSLKKILYGLSFLIVSSFSFSVERKKGNRKPCIHFLSLVLDVGEKNHLKICNPKLTSTWVYRVFCKGKCKMMVVFKAVPCCKALHWLRDVNHLWKNSNSIQASKNSYRWSSNTNKKCIVKQNHIFRSKASSVRTRRKKIEGRNRAFMYSDIRLKYMDWK